MFLIFDGHRSPFILKKSNSGASGGAGGSMSMGMGGGGNVGWDSRGDPSSEITTLLQSNVYTVGEGRMAGMGSEQVLLAAKSGEVLRWVVSIANALKERDSRVRLNQTSQARGA